MNVNVKLFGEFYLHNVSITQSYFSISYALGCNKQTAAPQLCQGDASGRTKGHRGVTEDWRVIRSDDVVNPRVVPGLLFLVIDLFHSNKLRGLDVM